MSRRHRFLLAGLGLAALLTGVLTACATPSGSSPTPDPTTDIGTEEVELAAAWLDDGRMVGLVTMGSSTCVPTAEESTLVDGVLEVDLVEPGGACTRDLVPRVTFAAVPEGVDPAEDLEIRVFGDGDGYRGQTELQGVEGLGGPGGSMTDFAPSAGWTGDDGAFVLLTWGSSTCLPIVESAEPTRPAEVTVTFATAPDDQVCTMDVAPQGTVVVVAGLEEETDVEAVLVSEGAGSVTVPIYGEN